MTGLRSKQKEETKERVLAAARKLFVERSFEDVGVRDIATVAGAATGTVISAFGSKGDLLNTIIVEDFHAQKSLIETKVQTIVGFRSRMLAIMVGCARFQANQLSIVRAGMADSWVRTSEAEHRVREALTPLMVFLTEEVEKAIRSGEVRSDVKAFLIAQMILDLQLNCYRLAIYDGVSMLDLEPHLDERLGIIIDGIAVLGTPKAITQAA